MAENIIIHLDKGVVFPNQGKPVGAMETLLDRKRITLKEIQEVPAGEGISVTATEGRIRVVQSTDYRKPDFILTVRGSGVEGVKTCSHCEGTGWLNGPNKPGCRACGMTGFEDGRKIFRISTDDK